MSDLPAHFVHSVNTAELVRFVLRSVCSYMQAAACLRQTRGAVLRVAVLLMVLFPAFEVSAVLRQHFSESEPHWVRELCEAPLWMRFSLPAVQRECGMCPQPYCHKRFFLRRERYAVRDLRGFAHSAYSRGAPVWVGASANFVQWVCAVRCLLPKSARCA